MPSYAAAFLPLKITRFILYKFTRTLPFTLYICRFAWLARYGPGLAMAWIGSVALSIIILVMLFYEAVGLVHDNGHVYSYHPLTMTFRFIYQDPHWANQVANLIIFPCIIPCL